MTARFSLGMGIVPPYRKARGHRPRPQLFVCAPRGLYECSSRLRVGLPLGVNVLRNDARSALAIAAAVGAAFIRVNIHTGARMTDQGVIEGAAHRTVRYRKLLGHDVKIFADVDVKHSAPASPRDL